MKRIVILLLCFILVGCGTMSRQRSVTTGFADFRPYTTAGMFISPDPYTAGDYTVLGEFSAHVVPGTDAYTYAKEELPANELLKIAVDNAKKYGANGIVDYRTLAHYSEKYAVLEYYEISALFILIHEL